MKPEDASAAGESGTPSSPDPPDEDVFSIEDITDAQIQAGQGRFWTQEELEEYGRALDPDNWTQEQRDAWDRFDKKCEVWRANGTLLEDVLLAPQEYIDYIVKKYEEEEQEKAKEKARRAAESSR